jgi:hypothetical protein
MLTMFGANTCAATGIRGETIDMLPLRQPLLHTGWMPYYFPTNTNKTCTTKMLTRSASSPPDALSMLAMVAPIHVPQQHLQMLYRCPTSDTSCCTHVGDPYRSRAKVNSASTTETVRSRSNSPYEHAKRQHMCSNGCQCGTRSEDHFGNLCCTHVEEFPLPPQRCCSIN